ncbi:MAG: DUF2249 domain-containing protein [Rhodobacteraceae bacterium]|nr:DUF2249 domain-containing protein [Paracoccaceae bacterium]
MTDTMKLLDVRPILQKGEEPFVAIMQAVGSLADGQGLRLLSTFKPVPLFSVLGKQGFSHEEKEIGNGDWQIDFIPAEGAKAPSADSLPSSPPATPPAPQGIAEAAKADGKADAKGWPAPALVLDNRGLMPPDPMVRTLEAIEGLAEGEVLEIHNDRDPLFLYPELAERGHLAHSEASDKGGYRVLIRKGSAKGTAA